MAGSRGVPAPQWVVPAGDSARRHWFPTFGPHFGPRHDPGNIYSRELSEAWVSQPFELPSGAAPAGIAWTAEEPGGARVRFQVRSARSREELSRSPWRGTAGESSYFDRPGPLGGASDHRWWQYRAVLQSHDSALAPMLRSVTLTVR